MNVKTVEYVQLSKKLSLKIECIAIFSSKLKQIRQKIVTQEALTLLCENDHQVSNK
jgi:hypothetical protein